MTTEERYKSTSTLLYDQAMVELEAGDLLQASEKLWGSAAQALKSIAEKRGWKHNSHAQFYNIVAELRKETNSLVLDSGFDAANQLHVNFYENRMAETRIRSRAAKVLSFIDLVAELQKQG